MDKKIIMIIDGLNMFIRSYTVDPSVSNTGEPIGGVKGTLKQLQKMFREINPDHVFMVWDGTGGSRRRRAINKNYKDGRKPLTQKKHDFMPKLSEEQERENQRWQLKRLIEILNLLPIRQFVFDNIEADDIIALLSQDPCLEDFIKVIVSNDKDFLQLASSSTMIWRPATEKFMTTKSILEEFSIHPVNMALSRAIAGDKGDNLDGVKGMGLKTVVKHFPEVAENKFLTLNEVFNKAREIDGYKIINNLVESEEVVRENYKIMQLYSPQVSFEVRESIFSDLRSEATKTDWLGVLKIMRKDNHPEDYNWSDLKTFCSKMSLESICEEDNDE